jgi:sec-independent protein translocase protein TatA
VTDISLLLAAGFGTWEIWVILLIILILFGSRLPGIARSLGQGINQFKKGLADTGDDNKPDASRNDATPAPKAKVEETKP